jgi:hypothetical protein
VDIKAERKYVCRVLPSGFADFPATLGDCPTRKAMKSGGGVPAPKERDWVHPFGKIRGASFDSVSPAPNSSAT